MKLVTLMSLALILAMPHSWRPELKDAAARVHVMHVPQKHWVASPEKFARYLTRSIPPPSTPPSERRPGGTQEPDPGEVLSGVELTFDTDNSVGFALVHDAVPLELIHGMFTAISLLGWHPVEGSEGIEPHEFEDGTLGVRIWLYRLARPLADIVRDVRAVA